MDRIKKELQMVNDEYSKSKKEASERNEKLTVELEKAQSNLVKFFVCVNRLSKNRSLFRPFL